MATGTIPKYMDGTDTGWVSVTNSSAFSGTIKWRIVGEFGEVKNSSWITLASDLATGSGVNLATLTGFNQTLPGYAYVRESATKGYLTPIWIESGNLRLINTSGITITTSMRIMVTAVSLI